MIDGSKKIFTSTGKPKQLYSDEESPMRSAIVAFINQNEIKSAQTSTHAHTVDRFRTFKKQFASEIGYFKTN